MELKKENRTYNNIGICEIELGNINKGLESYKKAIKLDPSYREAHVNIAITYLEMKDFNECLKWINISKDKKIDISVVEIILYTAKENYKKVIEIYDTMKNKEKFLHYEKYYYSIALLEEYKRTENQILINKLIKVKGYHYIDIAIEMERILNKDFYKEILEKIQNNLFKELIEELKESENETFDNINLYRYSGILNEVIEQENGFEKRKLKLDKEKIKYIKNKSIRKSNPEYFNDPFDPYYKRIDIELLKNLKNIKMTCFSSKDDNLLLWAHYADYHRGICIKYKLSSKEKIYIIPIIYDTINVPYEIKKKSI